MPLTEHELDLLIKRAQAEEMEAYSHYLETGEVRYLNLEEKGGIQLEDKALADLTVEISYRKGEGFEITFPNIEGEHITEVTTEATAKTIENVLRIRRIHGASHVALPVGAKTGKITVPNPE